MALWEKPNLDKSLRAQQRAQAQRGEAGPSQSGSKRKRAGQREHDWVFRRGRWQCKACLVTASNDARNERSTKDGHAAEARPSSQPSWRTRKGIG